MVPRPATTGAADSAGRHGLAVGHPVAEAYVGGVLDQRADERVEPLLLGAGARRLQVDELRPDQHEVMAFDAGVLDPGSLAEQAGGTCLGRKLRDELGTARRECRRAGP